MIPIKVLGDLISDMECEISDIKFNMRVYGDDSEFRNSLARMKLERLEKEVAELNMVYAFIVHYNIVHYNEEHKDER